MSEMVYYSENEADTINIARLIASKLSPCVVTLSGDLGAGKTVFAKGFVSFFMDDVDVISPTFSIVNSYGNSVYHFDLYRLNSEEELYGIGVEEYFYSGKFCLVEWPERVSYSVFPKNTVNIKIFKEGDNKRKIVVM